jgi:Sigma-70, region 4
MNMDQVTIEDEFDAAIASAYEKATGKAPDERWMKSLRMRFGSAGTVSTLDEAGEAIGVTRERVRQITAKIRPHLAGVELTLAKEAAEQLSKHSPVREPIGTLLSQSGLSRPNLTGAALLSMLEHVGTNPIDLIGADLLLTEGWMVEASEEPVMKALSMAKKHTGRYGMTTVEEIRQSLATEEVPLDHEDIERVLRAQSDVRWAGEWLWVEKPDVPHSSRMVNVVRSILSVNSPQTVNSIYGGLRRVWKFRRLDVLAPVAAVRAFLDASQPFTVGDGDLVSSTVDLDYRDLGDVTAMMIDILKATPHQVMDRQSLDEAWASAGVAAGTRGIWTTYGFWMDKYAPNVWGLRGANPNPAAVEEIRVAAKARSKAEPRRKEWSWAPDGDVLQTMYVTTTVINSGVMSFDPDVHAMLAGKSLRVLDVRAAIVKVGSDHTFSWGWHPVFRHLNAMQGGVLQLRINLSHLTVDATIGGPELWE